MLPQRIRYGMRFLLPDHIAYLTNPETLRLWAGKSLKDRCLLFHRHFGDHRINITLLRQFYRMNKIKNKKIKFTKPIKPDKEPEYEQWRLDMKDRIAGLKKDGYRIIYLDESIFTTKTIHTYTYSHKRMTLGIPIASVNQKVEALIFAISEENGVEYNQVFEKSVNTEKFLEYLDKLRAANPFDRIACFMDNMSVHRTNLVK